jgi:hypothetical protein
MLQNLFCVTFKWVIIQSPSAPGLILFSQTIQLSSVIVNIVTPEFIPFNDFKQLEPTYCFHSATDYSINQENTASTAHTCQTFLFLVGASPTKKLQSPNLPNH